MKKLTHDGIEREYELSEIQPIKAGSIVEAPGNLPPVNELAKEDLLSYLVMHKVIAGVPYEWIDERMWNRLVTIYEKWRGEKLYQQNISLLLR